MSVSFSFGIFNIPCENLSKLYQKSWQQGLISVKNWSYLKNGDIVDVIAPASAGVKSEIDRIVEYIEKLGLVPRIEPDLIRKEFAFSNSDDYRFNSFKNAVTSKDSKVIWCIRGGYGALRLTTKLIKLKPPKIAKLLIGSSDITILHHLLNSHWNWPTVYGPMLDRLASGNGSLRENKELKALLFGKEKKFISAVLSPLNRAAMSAFNLEGVLLGGNLKTLETVIGTPLQHSFPRKPILFLEDIDERGYSVDRMLVHLRLAGYLKKVQAIVLGDFVGGLEPNGRSLVTTALRRFAEEIEIPVVAGVKAGHGKIQRPLPLNTSCRLQFKGHRILLSAETGGR